MLTPFIGPVDPLERGGGGGAGDGGDRGHGRSPCSGGGDGGGRAGDDGGEAGAGLGPVALRVVGDDRGTTGRSSSRASATEPSSPAAIAWTARLPMAVASTGPARTGSPVAPAVRWHSRRWLDPPPTTWIGRRPGGPTAAASWSTAAAYAQGQALEEHAHQRRGVVGHGLARLGAERADARRHVARPQEALVVGVDERGERGRRLGDRGQLLVGRAVAGRPQGAAALLDQPQADDVAQQPDRAAHAALVGEVGRAAWRRVITGAGTSRPISDQVPRRQERGRGAGQRRAHDRGRRVVRARARSRACRASPAASARSGRRLPSTVPGCTISGRIAVGMPEPLEHRPGPVRGRRRPGTGSWRRSVYSATAAPDRKWANRSAIISSRSAWRQQRVVRADHREQLVERVDRHELDAGRRVDLLARHDGEGRLDHAVGPARRGSGPGSRAAGRGRRAARSRRPRCRRPTDATGPPAPARRRPAAISPNRRRTSQCRVPPTRDRDVGEAVDVLDREAARRRSVPTSDAAALGAEVDGREAERRCSVKAEDLVEAPVEAGRRVGARVDERGHVGLPAGVHRRRRPSSARKRSKSSTSKTPNRSSSRW